MTEETEGQALLPARMAEGLLGDGHSRSRGEMGLLLGRVGGACCWEDDEMLAALGVSACPGPCRGSART